MDRRAFSGISWGLTLLLCVSCSGSVEPVGRGRGDGGQTDGGQDARSDTRRSDGGQISDGPAEGSASDPDGSTGPDSPPTPTSDLHIIIDSDANNEVDDQHAIAYALFSRDRWHIDGVTTNRTDAGGDATDHNEEAERVVHLCGADDDVEVYLGPNAKFQEIKDHVDEATFDGHAAVNFIIAQAKHHSPSNKLVVIALGKLTNVTLALFKDPSITPNIKIFWLGSNWPSDEPEYNQWNDLTALEYLFEESDVEFDIAVVRYSGGPDGPGTASVTISRDEINDRMPGLGPTVSAIEGRNGDTFTCFGDYSIDLFEHIGSSVRALYDMAAVAMFKNPAWARVQTIGAPGIDRVNPSNPQSEGSFVPNPDNPRKVRFFDHPNRDAIFADFFAVMTDPRLD